MLQFHSGIPKKNFLKKEKRLITPKKFSKANLTKDKPHFSFMFYSYSYTPSIKKKKLRRKNIGFWKLLKPMKVAHRKCNTKK